ncbi:hypothetical protein F4818DRAFT_119161 [Hypoxylon cercidicola]|nr:hypothetical protein F4818DRAFT_119161 [Hypoxylon cercidicola]
MAIVGWNFPLWQKSLHLSTISPFPLPTRSVPDHIFDTRSDSSKQGQLSLGAKEVGSSSVPTRATDHGERGMEMGEGRRIDLLHHWAESVLDQLGMTSFLVVLLVHFHVTAFSCPHDAEYIKFGRWLDRRHKCTELNVTSEYGNTVSVQLEDSDWELIVSGNIKGGRKAFKVGGSRDFDVRFTTDGHMILQCWDGYEWGYGLGDRLDFTLLPFQRSVSWI